MKIQVIFYSMYGISIGSPKQSQPCERWMEPRSRSCPYLNWCRMKHSSVPYSCQGVLNMNGITGGSP